jgi:polyisoprenoid-binding protein YceI
MKKTIKHALLILAAILVLSPAHAAAPEWDLDFDHTGFYFSIDHIYSTVRGHFDKYEGTVMFSPDDLANSRFDFEVEIDSVNTNNSKRDRHLNSEDSTFPSDRWRAGERARRVIARGACAAL